MNKKLLTAIIGTSLILGACGDDSPEEATKENVQTEEAVEEVSSEDTVNFEDAKVGDTVADEDFGTYEIIKVASDVGSYESGPVTFDIPKVYLAKFTPTEGVLSYFDDLVGDEDSINVAVTLVSADNNGEEFVSFSPFGADIYVGGSKPYEGQMYLNEGDSDISAGKSQDFVTAYYLEDEDLSSISEIVINQSAPSADLFFIGDDVEVTVSFE